MHSKSQRVPGTESRATISGLSPATAYHVRLFAENTLGRSEAGPVMHAITELEAPSEAPSEVTADALGSRAIRVSWKPGYSLRMASSKYLSQIKGYYVGFKVAHSPSSVYSYKTVEVTSLTSNGSSVSSSSSSSSSSSGSTATGQYESIIGNLERLTKYVIIVKAFNRKGTGPPSDEIYVKTNDLGNEWSPVNLTLAFIYPFSPSPSPSHHYACVFYSPGRVLLARTAYFYHSICTHCLSACVRCSGSCISFALTFSSLKALHH